MKINKLRTQVGIEGTVLGEDSTLQNLRTADDVEQLLEVMRKVLGEKVGSICGSGSGLIIIHL
jgi:hypothetical protein